VKLATALAAGFLAASFVAPVPLNAQQSEPQAMGPRLTLKSVEAQVTALQTQVNSQQSTINSQQSTINSLKSTLASLQSTVSSLQSAVNSTTDFAAVGVDGHLDHSSKDVDSSSHLAPGQYEVKFTKDISECAYFGGPTLGGIILPVPAKGNPKVLDVFTGDFAGKAMEQTFFISVVCPSA